MRIWLALASTAFTLSCIFKAGKIFDSDTLWHIKAGEWILSHKTIPTTDMFSWSAPGANWVAHEWLFEAMLAFVSSPVGIALFSATLILTGLLFLWKLINLVSEDENTAIMFFILSMLLLTVGWSARPHLLAYDFFLLTLYLLYKGREKTSYLWFLPPLFLIWANCHASVLLGMGVVGLNAFLALIPKVKADRIIHFKSSKKIVGIFIVCVLTSLINPRGAELWAYAVKTVTDPIYKFIMEWQAPPSELLILGMFMPVVMGITFMAIRKNKMDLFLFILSILTLFGAMNSIRHFPYFVITWGILLAQLAGKVDMNKKVIAAVPGLLVAISLAGFINSGFPVNDPRVIAEKAGWPVKAVDWIEKNNADRIFNNYNWGGYLIYRNIPVFVDGRADMYHMAGTEKDAFQDISKFQRFIGPLENILNENKANYVLIPATDPQADYLLMSKNWYKAYSDDIAILLARKQENATLDVITPDGNIVSLNLQDKPAYFFSPG